MEDYEFFSSPISCLSSFCSKGINYEARKDTEYREGAVCHIFQIGKINGIPMIVKRGEDWILSGLKKNKEVLYRFFLISLLPFILPSLDEERAVWK